MSLQLFQWDKVTYWRSSFTVSILFHSPSHYPINTINISYIHMFYLTVLTPVISSWLFISSYHWPSRLHTGSHGLSCPCCCLSSLSFASLAHAKSSQYRTRREKLLLIPWFLLNKKWSSLSGSPFHTAPSRRWSIYHPPAADLCPHCGHNMSKRKLSEYPVRLCVCMCVCACIWGSCILFMCTTFSLPGCGQLGSPVLAISHSQFSFATFR